MDKPDVDSIDGLSPAIAIDQKQRPAIRVQRLERWRRLMTIYVYYTRVWKTYLSKWRHADWKPVLRTNGKPRHGDAGEDKDSSVSASCRSEERRA